MLSATFVHMKPYLFDSSMIACSERSKNNSMILLSSKLSPSFLPHPYTTDPEGNISTCFDFNRKIYKFSS